MLSPSPPLRVQEKRLEESVKRAAQSVGYGEASNAAAEAQRKQAFDHFEEGMKLLKKQKTSIGRTDTHLGNIKETLRDALA